MIMFILDSKPVEKNQYIKCNTFENLTVFTMVAVIYIILTQLLNLFIHSMEKKYRLK